MTRQRIKVERRPPVRRVQAVDTAGSGCPPLAILHLAALIVLIARPG